MTLRVLALEPYAARSHVAWLDGLASASRHEVRALTLPARAWKWRMRTASLHFARALADAPAPDVLLASDYVNLAELLALLPPAWREVPAVVYFHENQLTYPLQPGEARDLHFALVHLHAALAAARVAFNSAFHREAFLAALAAYLRHAPDVETADLVDRVRARSRVLPLGVDGPAAPPRLKGRDVPLVLWGHRHEWDKGPDELLCAVTAATRDGPPFRLRLGGERFREAPAALAGLREVLGERLEEVPFEPDRAAYLRGLAEVDVTLSTARHEFFGLATLEALRAGALPVLPDDLAYAELLPAALRDDRRFLYARADGAAGALAAAVEAARTGAWAEARRAIVAGTDAFAWDRVGPRADALLEEAVHDQAPWLDWRAE